MEGVTIARIASWSAVARQNDVLELVNQIQSGEPYNYRPGEIASSKEWFPPMVDRSDLTLVAYDATDRPVAYCVALPLAGYPDALAVSDGFGMQPSATGYLAELGVSTAMRRQGIASTLLTRATDARRTEASAWVVRTLENNAPAIALYQRHGFTLVPRASQIHNGRARVFLIRPNQNR
ncbi:MAG: GNAT family N-acetyltransferase [Pseudonocardiaceae bacterium]